jgi:Ca2+-binding RTX toxin-like protein
MPGWTAPAIQSVTILPAPLVAGETFSIDVEASDDVIQAIATVDFRPSLPRLLRVPLSQAGFNWTGAGSIPADIILPPGVDAAVKIMVFDAARQRAEVTLSVPLVSNALTAVFDPLLGILTVTGDNAPNSIVISSDPAGVILINGGAIPVVGAVPTIANTSAIRALGNGGDDLIALDEANAPLPAAHFLGGEGDDDLTGGSGSDDLEGGPGNDTLFGRAAVDSLDGGEGDDTLIGGQGNDPHFGGPGNDRFVWNPGDGSDLIEGQDGFDTLEFRGSNASESINLTANAARMRFFRNIANVVMDCDAIEQVHFLAMGGADTVVVNDLAGTAVTGVAVDLFNLDGTSTDLAPDTVVVNTTPAEDIVFLSGATGGEISLLGPTPGVTITGSEPANDRLIVNLFAGDDALDASGLEAGIIQLVADGGDNADAMIGSDGNDVLLGGAGDDVLLGGPGLDVLDGGPGDNIVIQ